MSSVVSILCENFHDPDTKLYHTRVEMSETVESGTRGCCSDDLGEFGQLFLEIKGVAHVKITPYVLMIVKAPLFDWDEIHPTVLSILGKLSNLEEMVDQITVVQ